MPKQKRSRQQILDESTDLKNRLEEVEETLRAIRQYMVDAFVITREDGEQVVTLSDASFPYRLMVESMNEGAITLIPDGTIFYCNSRFSEMVQVNCEKMIGLRFRDLVTPEDQGAFDTLLTEAGQNNTRGEFCLKVAGGECLPVQLSLYRLEADDVNGIAILATDISERIQAEEKIRALASELTIAEQEERHRISQILHDDLQQRLFAIRAQLTFLKDGEGKPSPEIDLTIDQIQDWLSEAITITRNLSINLSPNVLKGEGLEEAVSWLASQMKEQHGLQVEVEGTGALGKMDDHMRVLLFQVIRELLFNVVKHSGTLHAKVRMTRENGLGRISVIDSGNGFDVDTIMSDPQAAHGLLIIQDRLGLMGGNIEIDSIPGDGTHVSIEIPIENLSSS